LCQRRNSHKPAFPASTIQPLGSCCGMAIVSRARLE
jgi:hypothetical protein